MISMEKIKKIVIGILLPILMVTTAGCSEQIASEDNISNGQQVVEQHQSSGQAKGANSKKSLANLKFTGEPYVAINGNKTTFTKQELNLKDGYENYPNLDHLGRCKTVIAKVGPETMPTEDRKGIGMIKPSGWHTVRYDNLISDKYLYNRCHLIGFQLAGENANENNLITGTRYLNVEGMLPFEDEIADYVHSTGNHVIYKVQPVYKGNNLVASGVKMSAKSVEDNGRGVEFNVYCFNVQPGIIIDYKTGESRESGENAGENAKYNSNKNNANIVDRETDLEKKYVLNVNTKKYHNHNCNSVYSMNNSNKKIVKTTKKKLAQQGYEPCGNCQR